MRLSNMEMMQLLSLKSRATFFLLVVLLCIFSVGAWWSVSSLIDAEVKARLDSHADRISAALANRLERGGNNLGYVRAHFWAVPPRPEEFHRYVENIGLMGRNSGALALGYASLDQVPGRAPISLMEPADWRNRKALGEDLFNHPALRRTAAEAIRTGTVTLSDPVVLAGNASAETGPWLLLMLPTANGAAEKGIFFASIRATDFFNQIFGTPSLKREPVNFVLTAARDRESTEPIYNRFDFGEGEASPWIVAERPLQTLGQRLLVRVYPLPHFYSFADRYLALVVGLGAALLSCLIMVVMRVSQNQLDFEILAKESSMEAARQSRLQVENLRNLNRFDQSLAGELDVDVLVRKFVEALGQLTPVDTSFLYFAKSRARSALSLPVVDARGIREEELKIGAVPASWVERLFAQALHLRKGDSAAEEFLHTVLAAPRAYSDWVLTAVATREAGRCGLVFMARKNGRRFSEVDHELIESTVSQFSASIEIAQLFSRVEDASKAKNAFLANMSHEIRTPLSAIIGFSDMLTRERISAEQRAGMAENIRKNGEQLTCIIDDILDLSKVEAGKLKIERRRVRLESVMHELQSAMELRARDKGIEFSVEGVGSLPSHVHTDEVRLKQILMNLVGNSIKFTEKGSVQLIVRHLKEESGGNCLVFTIKDTGIGISDEARAELFRPFSQGDASHTRRYGGSGLGLALSKRLAQELGGDIALLDSIKGQGSTFELRVAAGDLTLAMWRDRLFERGAPRPKSRAGDLPASALHGLKILVVEDSEDNQEIFRYFLEASGARAEVVGNGIQAVKTASSGKYDMILMDIQIPGIDGKEATRRIRQQGFAKPIVALTAHAMAEEQESCMRAGCNGQITKPISGEMLISQVAEYMGRI